MYHIVGALSMVLNFPLPLMAGSVPDARGTWSGTIEGQVNNCQNPEFNGVDSQSGTFEVSSQSGSGFSGAITVSVTRLGFNIILNTNFSGTIAPDGTFSGSGTSTRTVDGIITASGTATFSGSGAGNNITVEIMGMDTQGDSCTNNSTFQGTRGGAIPPRVSIPMPDLNFDGIADVVWQNTDNGATAVWLMDTVGQRQNAAFPGAVSGEWVIRGLGDIDGNGSADLVWRNSVNGATAVWLMEPSSTTVVRKEVTFPGGADLVVEYQRCG